MRLRYSLALALVALLAIGGSAIADTGMVANMNGAQEVPANASPAVGNAIAVLNNAGTSLSFTVNYTGLVAPVTANHIHGPAPVGVNAGVIFPINQNIGSTSGVLAGTWNAPALTAVYVNYLLTGQTYFNIHTQSFPGGEIRGQILLDATPNKASTWGKIKNLYR
jgi:hypothetical protein